MRSYLDFEKPVAEIEAKIDELRALETGDSAAAIGEEIARLEAKAAQALTELYANLTPWQKTQVARHPDRPHCLDYVRALVTDFVPLSGDRKFGDDGAIVGGDAEGRPGRHPDHLAGRYAGRVSGNRRRRARTGRGYRPLDRDLSGAW